MSVLFWRENAFFYYLLKRKPLFLPFSWGKNTDFRDLQKGKKKNTKKEENL